MALGRLAALGPLRLGLVLVVGLGVTVGGGFAVGVLGTPSVVGVDNAFGDVTENVTEIETDLTVNNPNPVGVSLGDVTIDYEVRMNGIRMAQGVREGVAVGSGNSTVPFTTEMQNDRLPAWWASHLQNGENTTLTVNADVHSSFANRSFETPAVKREINTSLIRAFDSNETREMNAESPVVPDPVLVVRETRGEWGAVSEERTEIEMELVVYNPRSFPVTLTEIGYDVAMNDVRMGEGSSDREYVIPPGSERTVEATFVLDNVNLDEWWVTHLRNDQVTTLSADFRLRIDLSEGGGETASVPLDTMNRTIETDIFGSTDDGDSGDSDSDGATETESTATATPTPTETPTEDDGVLN